MDVNLERNITQRPRFEIDADDRAVQHLAPPSGGHRFEGVAFSPTGETLAVASISTNTTFLYYRQADGRFEPMPRQRLVGPDAEIQLPHDVSAARIAGKDLLAIVKRLGVISVFTKEISAERFADQPDFEIRGPQTRLEYSDGVAFVPPDQRFVAVNNLSHNSITFYRRTSLSPLRFELTPAFELRHPCLQNPDGLAFSACGRRLAIANHGNHSVAIFRRRMRRELRSELVFDPDPVQVIQDVGLVHPHSVAFSPRTRHLAVTNSGADYFCVFAPKLGDIRGGWRDEPILRQPFTPPTLFAEINGQNPMEGGPKGIAIHDDLIAVSSPELGIRVYPFREG